jgi:hypothetical protein
VSQQRCQFKIVCRRIGDWTVGAACLVCNSARQLFIDNGIGLLSKAHHYGKKCAIQPKEKIFANFKRAHFFGSIPTYDLRELAIASKTCLYPKG